MGRAGQETGLRDPASSPASPPHLDLPLLTDEKTYFVFPSAKQTEQYLPPGIGGDDEFTKTQSGPRQVATVTMMVVMVMLMEAIVVG